MLHAFKAMNDIVFPIWIALKFAMYFSLLAV